MAALRATAFLLFQIITLTVWATLFLIVGPFLPFRPRYRLAMRWPAMCIWAARTILGIRVRVLGAGAHCAGTLRLVAHAAPVAALKQLQVETLPVVSAAAACQ